MKPSRITIHCSASDNGEPWSAASIRKMHIEENGWSDIGYHLVIQPDGEVEKGRPLNEVGAHVSGHNKDNVGICLIGETKFSKAQFESLRYQLDSICMIYSIPKWMIFCHNQYSSAMKQGKTCPGFGVNELLGWYLTGDLSALKASIY